ncbi:MAG: ABC transporter permease subunit, partial [Fuerstiella sp.]|nr:ABC transporter permease subunit [Fuerstiella sp.]
MISRGLEEIDNAEDIDPITRQTMRAFLGSVNLMIDSAGQLQSHDEAADQLNVTGGPQFVDIKSIDVTREFDPNSQAGQLKQLLSRWDISFPQAMMWGVLGCVAGFAVSIVRERTMGTMLRLKVAPITQFQILAGKALACFTTAIGVIAFMTILGVALGMRPASY